MMRALVKRKKSKGLWLEEVPIPSITDHEVLVEVHKTGICGTDLHIFNWDAWSKSHICPPLTLGHEFMGRIKAIGQQVSKLKIGDRVSGEAHLTCGHCRNCKAGKKHLCPETKGLGIHVPGAFADYVKLPAENIYTLPDNISDELGAILDPLGNAAHTALSFNLVGEDVLITGAGPIGLMACAIAEHVGARNIVVTDVNDYRLQLAANMGATETVNIKKNSIASVITKLGITSGFDVGLEVSGQQSAIDVLIQHMYPGGRIALLGISPTPIKVDWHQIIFKELTLKGIYGREMFETWYKMISMLQSGLDILPVITHTFPASDYQKAFKVAANQKAGKVILTWLQ